MPDMVGIKEYFNFLAIEDAQLENDLQRISTPEEKERREASRLAQFLLKNDKFIDFMEKPNTQMVFLRKTLADPKDSTTFGCLAGNLALELNNFNGDDNAIAVIHVLCPLHSSRPSEDFYLLKVILYQLLKFMRHDELPRKYLSGKFEDLQGIISGLFGALTILKHQGNIVFVFHGLGAYQRNHLKETEFCMGLLASIEKWDRDHTYGLKAIYTEPLPNNTKGDPKWKDEQNYIELPTEKEFPIADQGDVTAVAKKLTEHMLTQFED
ncbi:hypothetical protein BDV96DRAFT_654446 [Lophiotrema nucula]|uniref:Uncharacterized protein n=1 Tax=Lophiotrema nucula TaxID=690887 RepID=A0A6A5YHY9_9PLEO|nr:hypothetical protein BDV96DRAFT_654446 [Lophiotrema nucula]